VAGTLERLRLGGIRAWIVSSAPEAADVRAALPGIAAEAAKGAPLSTHNRMNRVWRLSPPGRDARYILKMAWNNPAYPPGRRFFRLLRLLFTMPEIRAMRLAGELAAAGFATLRPLACWRQRVPGRGPCHFFLYPEVAARGSLADFLGRRADGWPFFARLGAKTRDAWARALRKMHEAGFLHLDPAPGNVLLKPGAPEEPGEGDFVWIDVESLRRSAGGPARTARERWRRVRSMTTLLRVFSPGELEAFAAAYAGADDPTGWLALFRRAAAR